MRANKLFWLGGLLFFCCGAVDAGPETWPFEKRHYPFDDKRGAFTLEPVVEKNTEVAHLRGFRVLDAAKREIQFVPHNYWAVTGKDALCVVDYNFDDFPDLMFEVEGGSAPNFEYAFWRFDPERGVFVDDSETFRDLAINVVDTDRERLSSSYRGGGKTYRWEDQKLILIRSYEEFVEARFDEHGLLKDGYHSTLTLFVKGVMRKRVRSERNWAKTEFPIEALIERFDRNGKLLSRKVVVQER